MAIKITPQQLAAQWATLPNKFEVNVLNFEVAMGRDTVDIFRKSFYLHRFNAPGSFNWPVRKDYKNHELMNETGNLKRSISYKRFSYKHKSGVIVYADRRALANSKRQYGRNFYYARVHNFGTDLIPQRQFIGDSIYILGRFNANKSIIFNGFPQ